MLGSELFACLFICFVSDLLLLLVVARLSLPQSARAGLVEGPLLPEEPVDRDEPLLLLLLLLVSEVQRHAAQLSSLDLH